MALIDYLPKEVQPWVNTAAAVGVGGAGGGGVSLASLLGKGVQREWSDYMAKGGSGYGGGGGGYAFELPEFMPIEAFPPIDVNGLVAEIGAINEGRFQTNATLADATARTSTQGIFDDFEQFVDSLLPGYKGLVTSSVNTVQEFIDTGLPRAVQNNAMSRDAASLAAGGIRGQVGANRLMYNEAQRDIAAQQYGIGAAQQMVAQAQSVAGQFANLQGQLGSNYLGQLNQMTTITPAQGVGFAFDERQYQTGVMEFNATGEFNESNAGAQLSFNYAQLGQQASQFQQQRADQEKARRDAERSSMFGLGGSLIGMGIGAALAPATGGASLALAMGVGAQVGGGIGQAVGGNYAGAQQNIMGGLGTYAGYQQGVQQMNMQQQYLDTMQRAYGYQPGMGMAPWAPTQPVAPTAPAGWGTNFGGSYGPTLNGSSTWSGVPYARGY